MAPITKREEKMASPRGSVSGMSAIAKGLQKKTQGSTEIAVLF